MGSSFAVEIKPIDCEDYEDGQGEAIEAAIEMYANEGLRPLNEDLKTYLWVFPVLPFLHSFWM